ncbi:MAG: hypothetical protein IJ874_03275 [Ruminococcus sp.]|nr:hypothetical protein [Ruminococcus sp.]
MSYYRIKCLTCLRRFRTDELLYNIIIDDIEDKEEADPPERVPDSTDGDARTESGKAGEETAKKKRSTGRAMAGGENGTEVFDTDRGRNSSDAQGEMVSAFELLKKCVKIEPLMKDISLPHEAYVNPDLKENGSEIVESDSDSVIVGYEVEKLRIGNTYYNGKLRKRYCPYCWKTKGMKTLIPPEAGTVPFFTIAMLGHSTAGKTTFLTFQKYSLANGDLFRKSLPDGLNLFQIDYYSHIGSYDNDIILQKFKDVQNYGIIPSTTENIIPPTHCLDIRIKPDGTGEVLNECIVCFKDVAGELYTDRDTNNRDKEELHREVKDFCRIADAILLFTDPFSLKIFNRTVVEEIRDKVVRDPNASPKQQNDPGQSHEGVADVMRHEIIDIFKEMDSLNKPVVNILAKADELSPLAGTIRQENHVIAGSDNIAYEATQTWNEISKDTFEAVEILDNKGEWYQMIKDKFINAYHVPVSAIGGELVIAKVPVMVNDAPDYKQLRPKLLKKKMWDDYIGVTDTAKKEEYIKEFARYNINDRNESYLIKPKYIALPLIYLLSQFGMIPAYADEMRYNSAGVARFFKENTQNSEAAAELMKKNAEKNQRKAEKKSADTGTKSKLFGIFGRKK